MTHDASSSARIRVGIGGWTFEPWRDNFYPKGLAHAKELHYASRKLTAIEVNGTYYSTFTAKTFAKWRDDTPDDFMFSLKANKFTTNRRVLAEAGESVTKFVESGLAELAHKLGPVLWQFAPSKKFDPVDFEAFLKLLPPAVGGFKLRHVMDVRHDSFRSPEYLALARKYNAGTVFTDSDDYPPIADVTADFVYTRMMRTDSQLPEGCTPEELDQLAECGKIWRDGGQPKGLPLVEAGDKPKAEPRDVFMYFISGAKEKAPHAAMGLQKRLGLTPKGDEPQGQLI